jgi:Flp pilus assembly protein TadG
MGLRDRDEHGSAVVDFVLVTMVLVPLFLGILQLALVLHVRNTLTSAASEGARYAATVDRGPADGVVEAREQLAEVLDARYHQDIEAAPIDVGGVPGVEVVIQATVPALGLGGPSVDLTVRGTAVEEPVP